MVSEFDGSTQLRCNICGGTAFTDMPKRPKVRCVGCGSLERTRAAALYLNGCDRPVKGARILHFAPELGLARRLRDWAGDTYRAVDINPAGYPGLDVEPFDLCRDLPSLGQDTYDLIIHNHVLEHVECNYTAVLVNLIKALTQGGRMLFSIPILPGDFEESLLDAPLNAKRERFGPSLHVRRFGDRMLRQTLGMVIKLPDRYDLMADFPERDLVAANIPKHHWQAFTGASIFRVARSDLLL